jgi:hypothetical protein
MVNSSNLNPFFWDILPFLAYSQEVLKWNASCTDCKVEGSVYVPLTAHPAYHAGGEFTYV